MTPGEKALVHGLFGAAIDCESVRIRRRRFFPLQPANVTMAPMGHLHFHPASVVYCDDFAAAPVALQAFFLHEMTHVWQAQTRGRWWLVLLRHPMCRYHYTIRPGWSLAHYGIEQQAEIVRHVHLARHGMPVPGSPGLAVLESILPFGT